MKSKIYLDYNSTTPIFPDVIDAMSGIMWEAGNASSIHSYGRSARSHIESAREQVAEMLQTDPNYVIFTSGATESNNSVLKAFANGRVLISAMEHPSVLEALIDVEYIPVTKDGIIDLEAFEKMISTGEPPMLISVMLVNNETGVIQPIQEMTRIARRINPHIHIHTDASQAPGRIPLNFSALGVDYMSLSAHKFGGPQGTGALIIAPGAKDVRLFHGGGQEKHRRAGTENVAGIVGMGLAAKKAETDRDTFTQKLTKWRDDLETTLQSKCPSLHIFGQSTPRICNTSSLCLPGIPAETQLMALDLDGIALSNGSACASGKIIPSHVLLAMGASEAHASQTLRLSLGWANTADDIQKFTAAWLKMAERLKNKIKP